MFRHLNQRSLNGNIGFPLCMKIIGRQKLWACAQVHPEACQALSAWLREVEVARWVRVEEVQRRFPMVEVMGGQMFFWLCQRRYRIEARLSYGTQILSVEGVAKMSETLGLFDEEVAQV